jgi:hypothetical protein
MFVPAGRVHEAVPARAEEEARPGDQAAAQELKAEGDPHQEAVQGHLQDTDQAVQGAQGPGASATFCVFLQSCGSGFIESGAFQVNPESGSSPDPGF